LEVRKEKSRWIAWAAIQRSLIRKSAPRPAFFNFDASTPNARPVSTVIRSCGFRRKRRSITCAFCFVAPEVSISQPNCISAIFTGER
jgi:hypothetical protein